MALAVTESLLHYQRVYFPERAQINEENVSFIHEINFNVETMLLHNFFRNYETKSPYTSTPLLFVRIKEIFRHTAITHTLNSRPQ